jgi:hypothetical protein
MVAAHLVQDKIESLLSPIESPLASGVPAAAQRWIRGTQERDTDGPGVDDIAGEDDDDQYKGERIIEQS